MFVEIKLTRIKNARSDDLFHGVNKIVNSEIRTFGKQLIHLADEMVILLTKHPLDRRT